jgi:hypothetical protein
MGKRKEDDGRCHYLTIKEKPDVKLQRSSPLSWSSFSIKCVTTISWSVTFYYFSVLGWVGGGGGCVLQNSKRFSIFVRVYVRI